MDYSPPGSSVHGNSPGKNTGVGCHALLQGISPPQGLNSALPHCGQILYHLSHQGSPRILKCVAYPFSRGSSKPRNRTGASCIAGGFFTSWATREPLLSSNLMQLLALWGFPSGSDSKESAFNARPGFDPWVWKIPWKRVWKPTPVFLPGKFCEQRRLAAYSPWGSQRVRYD